MKYCRDGGICAVLILNINLLLNIFFVKCKKKKVTEERKKETNLFVVLFFFFFSDGFKSFSANRIEFVKYSSNKLVLINTITVNYIYCFQKIQRTKTFVKLELYAFFFFWKFYANYLKTVTTVWMFDRKKFFCCKYKMRKVYGANKKKKKSKEFDKQLHYLI